ncbi:MAG TPA: TlpA disulfide reductase family protein [Xanthobacteraceae bacterium]|jgi:thiol-disulfide isomerase/thioredoxin
MRKLLLAIMALAIAMADSAAAGPELRAFVRGSWQAILEAHRGQPTIVHFWGVTCGPCRLEMPQWGRLLREHPGLGLVVIDADLVPNAPDAVSAVLAETGLAGAESWMFADGFLERLRYEVDRQWHGEIPRTMLIARDGTISAIEGSANMEAVRAWLDAQGAGGR